MIEELLFALIGDMAITIVTHVFISIYSSMYLMWEAIETHVRTKKENRNLQWILSQGVYRSVEASVWCCH